jgi:hypothetical protein
LVEIKPKIFINAPYKYIRSRNFIVVRSHFRNMVMISENILKLILDEGLPIE